MDYTVQIILRILIIQVGHKAEQNGKPISQFWFSQGCDKVKTTPILETEIIRNQVHVVLKLT